MNLRTRLTALGLLSALASTTGCYVEWGDDPPPRPLVPPTPDTDAPATFTFSLSRGCASVLNTSACGPDRPLMVGVREAIRFSVPYAGDSETPTVTSSDPETLAVRSVTVTSSSRGRLSGVAEVRGLRVGASTVTILSDDGRAWSYDIRVDEAAGMILEGDEGNPRFDEVEGRLNLRVGERVSLTGYPVNLNVERLYANDGVTWTAPDTRVVNLSWQLMSGARVVDDHAFIEGRAPGTVVLNVRAGVVERIVTVEVTN
ncbi:MAG: hypothetical protein R3A48_27215 [Polyangiales bacterium]